MRRNLFGTLTSAHILQLALYLLLDNFGCLHEDVLSTLRQNDHEADTAHSVLAHSILHYLNSPRLVQQLANLVPPSSAC